MSKNKLSWIFALFLVAIASLPIAYAAEATGFNWMFVLINAAIVGIVLFVLQAFLIPNKAGKEQTAVWVVIILASLVVAFLFGSSNFIWRAGPFAKFLNVYILVNSVVISIVLYFLMGLLKINQKLGSQEGKTGYGILIFIISVFLAYNLSPNQYIWSQATVKALFDSLFSGEAYTGPRSRPGLAKGILHPKGGLIVFVVSLLMLSFFFKNFLIKGQDQKLSYALAFIFALQMASPPANSMKDVIQLGEIFFILILWESLKTTVPADRPEMAFFLAVFMIGWASAAVTVNSPEHRAFLGSFFCDHTPLITCQTAVGTPGVSAGAGGIKTWGAVALLLGASMFALRGKEKEKKWGGLVIILAAAALLWISGQLSGFGFIGIMGAGIFGIIGVIALIVILMIKGERGWESKKLKGRYPRLIRNVFWDKIDELSARTGLHKKAWRKRRLTPDMLPQILRENIVILFSLSNYLKRLYIWYVKRDQVKIAESVCADMWRWIGIYDDYEKLEKEIYECRNGIVKETEEEFDDDRDYECEYCGAKFKTQKETIIIDGVDTEGLGENGKILLERHIYNEHPEIVKKDLNAGWFNSTKRCVNLLNEISLFLGEYIKKIIEEGGKSAEATYVTKILSQAKSYNQRLQTVTIDIERSYKYLNRRARAYGNYQPIRAQKYLVLDQCNPYGWHEHQYKFIPPGTLLSDGTRESRSLEVNQYGEVLEDKNGNTDRFYNPTGKAPRKVHPDEIRAGKIKDLTPPEKIMEAAINDWEGFIKNMRYGIFRYNSKFVSDYLNVLSTEKDDPNRLGKYGFYKESNIKFTPGWKTEDKPAFDRRALVNTGILTFVGRKNFVESWQDIYKNQKTDPYPGVSSYGMGLYISDLVRRDVEDLVAANEYLKIFLRDKGKPVESASEASDAFEALYAASEQESKQ